MALTIHDRRQRILTLNILNLQQINPQQINPLQINLQHVNLHFNILKSSQMCDGKSCGT
jgi:hypothetical protein